jgi:hypothetical protein
MSKQGTNKPGICRLLIAASAISVGTALGAMPAHAQETTAARQFNVPAQSLGKALLEFGRQAEISISAPSEATNGKTSHPVVGRMTPQQALARLLQGTGLRYEFVNASAVRVIAARENASAEQGQGPAPFENDGADQTIVVTGTRLSGVREK